MWIVGIGLGTVGAAGIAAVIWWERAALRRLKRKREPKTGQLETILSFDFSSHAEAIKKFNDAMHKVQQGMGHVHCRTNWDSVIGVTRPEPTGPPDILCSACGATLERNDDHFDCTGCGRRVEP